jgi:hypothetical protein
MTIVPPAAVLHRAVYDFSQLYAYNNGAQCVRLLALSHGAVIDWLGSGRVERGRELT